MKFLLNKNCYKKKLNISIIAIAYACTFVFPFFCGWMSFVWLGLLIHSQDRKQLNFYDGFLWGVVFFGIHLSWMGYLFLIKSTSIFRISLYFLTIIYYSIISGIWLQCTQLLCNYAKNILHLRLFIWLGTTLLFQFFITYRSLWFLGRKEGYPLVHPLLSIVEHDWYLNSISWTGEYAYWLIVILINILLYLIVFRRQLKSVFLLIPLFCFPIFLTKAVKQKEKFSLSYLYIKPTWHIQSNLSASESFYTISNAIDTNILRNEGTKIDLLVMPESVFNFNLMDWKNSLEAWTSLMDESGSIVLCGHRECESCCYNTAYQICNGKVIAYYDKSHLVPFIETSSPWLCTMYGFQNIFLNNQDYFSCGDNLPNQDVFTIAGKNYQIFICSELYFETKSSKQIPAIVLANDDWFVFNFAKLLAKLKVKLWSMKHNVPVVCLTTSESSEFL